MVAYNPGIKEELALLNEKAVGKKSKKIYFVIELNNSCVIIFKLLS
jgi:hypothetical protein